MNWHNQKLIRCSLVAAACILAAIMGWWFLAYDNYHSVLPGELYRSAQMDPKRLLDHAAHDHLATVINLRPETTQPWHAKEAMACSNHHIAYLDVPLIGDQTPSLEQINTLVETMRNARKPLLIHCKHGADRTGFAVALYLKTLRDQPEATAQRALSIRYGHSPLFKTKCFDKAFDDYCRRQ